mgnify:CR=1 FL=1
MEDDYVYSEPEGGGRRSVTQHNGVRVTVCQNRFEVLLHPNGEMHEQNLVQALRGWIRHRQKELQRTEDLSG